MLIFEVTNEFNNLKIKKIMKTMKNLMTTLLVTFMLLFTFNGNGQTVGCGSGYDNQFSEDDFTYSEDGLMGYNESTTACSVSSFVPGSFSYTFTGVTGSDYKLELDYKVENIDQVTISINDVIFNDDDLSYDGSSGEFGTTTITNIQPNNGEVKITFSIDESDIYYLESFKLESTDPTASLQENNLDQLFKVFSFNDEINIQTTEFKNYDLEVYNISGRLVSNNMNLNGNFKKNISESGIYIVKLQFENEVLTKKLFIK